MWSSVAILAQAISCSNVHGVFPVHERFCFCLVQVSTTQLSLFLCISFVLMAADRASEDALHTSLPFECWFSSWFWSRPRWNGHPLRRYFGRKTRCLSVKMLYTSERRSLKFRLSQHGCSVWIHISRKHLEISRVDLQRWNRISVPSLQVCATSRHMLPQHQMFPVRQDPGLHSNMLTAPQPQGPMAQGHLMTIETHDEDLILPQAQKMNNQEVPSYSDSLEQYLKGMTKWTDTLLDESNMQAWNKPVRIHCKAGSVSVRLVFETRGKCQDIIVRYEDDGIPFTINSPFCCSKTTITVVQSRSIEEREIGKQLKPLWKELADQLKVLLPDADYKGVFIITALDSRSQILSVKDRRNGIGKKFSNLLHLVADKRLCSLHLICLFLVFRMRCYNGFSLKPTGLRCDGRSFASPLLRRLPGRGAFFFGFLIRWVLHLAFSLIRGVAIHESSSCSREDALGDCGRPCDHFSCLLFTALWLVAANL